MTRSVALSSSTPGFPIRDLRPRPVRALPADATIARAMPMLELRPDFSRLCGGSACTVARLPKRDVLRNYLAVGNRLPYRRVPSTPHQFAGPFLLITTRLTSTGLQGSNPGL